MWIGIGSSVAAAKSAWNSAGPGDQLNKCSFQQSQSLQLSNLWEVTHNLRNPSIHLGIHVLGSAYVFSDIQRVCSSHSWYQIPSILCFSCLIWIRLVELETHLSTKGALICTNLEPFQHGEGCKILPQLPASANTGLAQTIFETISSILQPPISSPKGSVLASDTRVQNLTRAYRFLPMENQAASDKEAVLMLFVKMSSESWRETMLKGMPLVCQLLSLHGSSQTKCKPDSPESSESYPCSNKRIFISAAYRRNSRCKKQSP